MTGKFYTAGNREVIFDMSKIPSKYENVSLAGATFVNVDLSQSSFDDVNLSKASFENVSLAEVKFEDVSFENASIEECNLEGMRIGGVLVSELIRAYAEKSAGAARA